MATVDFKKNDLLKVVVPEGESDFVGVRMLAEGSSAAVRADGIKMLRAVVVPAYVDGGAIELLAAAEEAGPYSPLVGPTGDAVTVASAEGYYALPPDALYAVPWLGIRTSTNQAADREFTFVFVEF